MRPGISVVEDDRAARRALEVELRDSTEFRLVSAHADAEEALAELPKLEPDVVLLDLFLPGMSGLECAKGLKAALPKVKLIVISAWLNEELLFRALRAGAEGYLQKEFSQATCFAAIREVLAGGMPLCAKAAKLLIQTHPGVREGASPVLSSTEFQILTLLSEGKLYKEIAAVKHVSPETVKTHVHHIFEKLAVSSRAEAQAYYWTRLRWSARPSASPANQGPACRDTLRA